MFGIKEISIEFLSGLQILVWPVLLILLFLGVMLYLRTNPPLPRYLRIILVTLRFIAIIALILALLEPVVSFTREFERKPRLALILDESTSMDKTEAGISRKARRDSLLSGEIYARLEKNIDIDEYYAGGNLTVDPDKVDKDKTALGDALYQLGQYDLNNRSDFCLLLSDGNSNSGRDPKLTAEGLGIPVIAVDMSSDSGNFDFGITDVEYNPILFVGRSSEIKVKFNWYRAKGHTVNIELVDSNRVVKQSHFEVNQDDGLGEAVMTFTPDKPGQKLLKINIPTLEGEDNTRNNQRTFSVKVLKSKLLVLLATDHPDYEVGFLKRYLEQSDKYDVELLVTGAQAGNLGGQFPAKQTELNRYDLIILYDPDPRMLESRKAIVNSYLAEKGGAMWVLMGEQYASRGPVEWFNKLLPFYQSRQRNIEYVTYHGVPSEGNLYHPSLRLAENQTSIREAWSELPPFDLLVQCNETSTDAVVLAYASLDDNQASGIPVLGYKRIGPGKVFGSACLPFWSWGFINLGFGEDNSNYGKFIEGTVSWLTVPDGFTHVTALDGSIPSKSAISLLVSIAIFFRAART